MSEQVERLIAAIEALTAAIREWRTSQAERVVSINEAAHRLGRTRQTISRMVKEGRLRKVTRHGVTGILLSDIENGR